MEHNLDSKNDKILEQMNETSYMLNDLSVYLDRYPSDERAANWFGEYDMERQRLLKELDSY